MLLGASTSDILYADNELENFSFTLKADNVKVSYHVNCVL